MDSGPPQWNTLLKHWQVSQKSGRVWGFDIGGANLKVVCLDRPSGHLTSQSHSFALWRTPQELSTALQALTASFAAPDQIVITTTGEIADCFPRKSAGVAAIVDQCEMAFARRGVPIRYYAQTASIEDRSWLRADEAKQSCTEVAASNWHAVARLWGNFLSSEFQAPGLIADLGSTTLDLTVVGPDRPLTPASDWQRIQTGRLVYTGARRSPLSMILPTVNYRGLTLPLAQELFATIHDAYLLTELIDEDEENNATADGRPATRDHAAQRIARMFCSDAQELPSEFLHHVAMQAQSKHLQLIASALARPLREEPGLLWLLNLGEGERLLFVAMAQTRWSMFAGSIRSGTDLLGPEVSGVMPAVAVAILAP
ncbi:MAG: hypothetical protein Q8M16_10910 [Pirellulaceae bacterium]|nr:hypothetical protein [Pirellulaceae bacterium]